MITLEHFKDKYIGKLVGCPDYYGNNNRYIGQCVSLCVCYCYEVLGLELWGPNAKLWADGRYNNYFNDLGNIQPQYGDLIVFTDSFYGHIMISLGKNVVLEQDGILMTPTTIKTYQTLSNRGTHILRPKMNVPILPQIDVLKEITVGDMVIVNGYGTAGSDGSGNKTRTLNNETAVVIRTNGLPERPYGLAFIKSSINNKWVDGWFRKEDINK